MQVRDFLTDDDAVSPVIGVILMVAITVILAAVIAAFVLGLGDTNDVAPNTTFNYEYNKSGNNDVVVRHRSGDTFDSDRVTISGDKLLNAGGRTWDTIKGVPVTEVAAGDKLTLNLEDKSTGNPDEYRIEIRWQSADTETSSIISTDTGPGR